MNNEKVLEILNDKAFAEKILKIEKPEQVQAAFKEKGVDISIDEVKAMGSILNKMVEKNTTKLSAEDLNEIAGGDGVFADFIKGLGEGAIDVPLDAADLITGRKYTKTLSNLNPLRSGTSTSVTPVVDTSNGTTPTSGAGPSGPSTATTFGRGAGAGAAIVFGAGALMATGVVACKGVKWGYKKLRGR